MVFPTVTHAPAPHSFRCGSLRTIMGTSLPQNSSWQRAWFRTETAGTTGGPCPPAHRAPAEPGSSRPTTREDVNNRRGFSKGWCACGHLAAPAAEWETLDPEVVSSSPMMGVRIT